MNTRREFFQNNILSFGVFPFLNKFNIVNNDNDNTPFSLNEIRWDVANKVCENFILQMQRKIKSQTKNIHSISIYWDDTINDPKRVGIYGFGCSDNNVLFGTSIDWLKKYNVSTDLVINSLCSHYIDNGYSRSKPIFGSKGTKWGMRVYK